MAIDIITKVIDKTNDANIRTLLDLTKDTVASGNLAKNETAHDREGVPITGKFLTEDAEAWAAGTRNGIPVNTDDVTYHNNSHWYAQVSEAEAYISGSCMRIAGEYAEDAESSMIACGSILHTAGEYKDAAEQSAIVSGSCMRIAGNYAEDSEAWAVGKRDGSDVPSTDPTYHTSSKYWADIASQYAQGGLIYKGSITFANIPTSDMRSGDMYNMEDDFTTDSRFQEGSGVFVKAGSNIVWNGSKWDVLAIGAVTGVKGNAETDYRHGNVNITHANLGMDSVPTANSTNPVESGALKTALDGKLGTSGDSKSNTITFTSSDNASTTAKTNSGITSVATLSSGETHASLFNKISGMFLNIRKLWNTIGTTALDTTNFGATLTAQMKQLTDGNVYSTSETWTGQYWIDGKKIWRKIFDFGYGPNSSWSYKNHGISNIDVITRYQGVGKYPNGIALIAPSPDRGGGNPIAMHADITKYGFGTSSDSYTTVYFYAILEYTKTT